MVTARKNRKRHGATTFYELGEAAEHALDTLWRRKQAQEAHRKVSRVEVLREALIKQAESS